MISGKAGTMQNTQQTDSKGKKRERVYTDKYFKEYSDYLRRENLSENTRLSYLWTIKYFLTKYRKITADNLLMYKSYLVEYSSPNTVNLRIQGINKYLKYIGMADLKLKSIHVQQKMYLENVISNEDYNYLKKQLKKDDLMTWYYLVWFMAATGARVSEVIKFKAEHVVAGYADIYGKGEKRRRLYIPTRLQKSAIRWIEQAEIRTGPLFLSREGQVYETKSIEAQIKKFANKYKIDPNVMYPHSFRHLFGKNFIDKYNDLVFLADIMGHESIETTRIYLRKTALEQRNIMNKVVDW